MRVYEGVYIGRPCYPFPTLPLPLWALSVGKPAMPLPYPAPVPSLPLLPLWTGLI